MGSKTDYYKGHDTIPIKDGHIFKLGIFLKEFYARLGPKKNSKWVSLIWMATLKGTSPDTYR